MVLAAGYIEAFSRSRRLAALALLIWGSLSTAVAEERQRPPFHIAALLRDPIALNEAHDVQLLNDLAYIAGKGNCISIIDISDPYQPEFIWTHRDPHLLEDCETILVEQGRLFLGATDFHSIDVSDPRQPRFDSTIVDRERIDTINGLVRRGPYLFAACKRGMLTAMDVSNPTRPAIVGGLPVAKEFGIRFPHDVDFYDDLLVVVDANEFGVHPGTLALFRVMDASGRLLDASDWQLHGKISGSSLSGANRVQVKGQYAFVAGSYSPKVSLGRRMAKGIVVDMSDSSRPQEIATVDFPDLRGPNGLTLQGDVWFLAGGQTIQAYDIRNPRVPKLLGSLFSKEAFPTADDNAHDLVYRDGFLYVTSQGDHGLVIFNVDDPEIRRLAEDSAGNESKPGR